MHPPRLPLLALLTLPLLLPAPPVRADCTTGECIPGGGNSRTDCLTQFFGTGLRPNFPIFDPNRKRNRPRQVHCFDGDAACDRDGQVNQSCRFNVDVCLHDDQDPAACTPSTVVAAKARIRNAAQDGSGLEAAIQVLLPASAPSCTEENFVDVPLTPSNPGFKKTRATVAVSVSGDPHGKDGDRLVLVCHPRVWPSHGYDHANTRATPVETKISPASVDPAQGGGLVLKWDFPLNSGVTGTPVVSEDLVIFGAWDGKLYALDRESGQLQWSFETGRFFFIAGSALLTPEGRVLVGDAFSSMHALRARDGKLLWTKSLGDPAVDQIWSSPQVVSNRVIVGVASHNDQPCTNGRTVALDLDTGELLWTRENVPERICTNDTAIECSDDSDCVDGTCVQGRGAGVTATVAVDPTGESVYVNTVGCFTYPSIGDSDSMMKLNTRTGATEWITRVDPPEQFGFCVNDPPTECGSSADCPPDPGGNPGVCELKNNNFHDFGFINGPILADVGGATRVISASKNGTLYAFDPANGNIAWERAVLPKPISPAFAGFGLFNGAVAFAGGRIYAALYQFAPATVPAPDHLQAYDATNNGSTVWTDDIGASWGHVSHANGVLFTGSNGTNGLFVYEAATGRRIDVLPLPTFTSAGPAIVDGVVYAGYGVFGATGGVRAFDLAP